MSSLRQFDLRAYTQDIQDQIGSSYEIIEPLGSGQNSIAYSVKDLRHGDKKCLKTISPAITVSSDRREASKKLEKEVRILSKLSHRCLPQVFFSNFLADYPFYICTFHPGDTWDRISSGETKLDVQFRLDHIYYIISSLFDTFEYLHSQGVTHGDFHPKNILVGENIYRDGILVIDFGSSLDGQKSDERKADFSAIGKTLQVFRDKFFENSSHEQFMLFVDFCKMLISDSGLDWKFVKRRLDFVVDPQFLQTKTEFLFSREDGSRPALTIPASRPIPVGKAVQEIIETDAFQRLRGIRQLSFCDWEYPGATHTRYEHSLGVYGITKQALDFLARDQMFRNLYEARDVVATLAASLLHDTGHYPFAHVIEHYVSNRYQGPEHREMRHQVHHLSFSKQIVNDDSQVIKALKGWGKELSFDVLRILSDQAGMLSQLLDGPVDCDKIDYLKRDSLHCGIAYGGGFDAGELIKGFRCSTNGASLQFDAGTVPAIEGFMILQDQMLSNVYWHPNVRALFAMFHRFIDATVGSNFDRILTIVNDLRRCSSDFEAIQTVFLPLAKGKKNQEDLVKFVELLMTPGARKVFRPLATFTRRDKVPTMFRGRNVFETIVQTGRQAAMTGALIDWKEVQHLRNSFQHSLKEKGISIPRLDILIDIPWGKNAPRMVYIVEPDAHSEPEPIINRSHLSETIFSDPTAFSAPIRVFVPFNIAEKAQSKIQGVWFSAMEHFYNHREAPRAETLSDLDQ